MFDIPALTPYEITIAMSFLIIIQLAAIAKLLWDEYFSD
jgi:hypothetical protein